MNNHGLRFDAEYLAVVSTQRRGSPGPPNKDVWELRSGAENALRAQFQAVPMPKRITSTKIVFKGRDGADLFLYRFSSREQLESPSPTPAIVEVHGGGMVSCSAEIFASRTAQLADRVDMPVFSVDYRLAPEHRSPGSAEDVFYGLKHLSEHAAAYNIDPQRLCLLGESGGGGIAAGAALLARDSSLTPPLAKQVLVYPMLDDRTTLPQDAPLHDFLTWNVHDNRIAWAAVLGEDNAGKPEANVSVYAAPGRATDLSGLPPTYIDSGSLDLFRDECLAYVAKLAEGNVEVEFHLWPGLPHGFEGVSQISWAGKALAARDSALTRILSRGDRKDK